MNRLLILLAVMAALILFLIEGNEPGSGIKAEDSRTELSLERPASLVELSTRQGKSISYAQYLSDHDGKSRPDRVITIPAAEYSRADGGEFRRLEAYKGHPGTSLLRGEGEVEWKVHVEEEGMYNLSLLYYPVEGKSSSIERSIRIDGKLPFQEAGYLQFDRIWDNAKDGIDQDNQGNDQRPKQIERPVWVEAVLKDADGYITEPFLFTLKRRAYRDSYSEGSRW